MPPAKVPTAAAPPCPQCRPYADALGVAVGLAEWFIECAKRQMVPDVFTVGVCERKLAEAVAGVNRGPAPPV
jgi:hypothetical protein